MQLSGLDILLAEDNPTNQMVAVQMLETLGAAVMLAADGEEALRLAEERPFDLALIDIEMPNLSGLEVIRHLRAGPPPKSQLPLIALTAYVMREHREAIDEAGADGVIAKPILSIEKLAEDILEMVAARRGKAGAAPAGPAAAEGAPAFDPGALDGLAASLGRDAMPSLMARIEADLAALRAEVLAAVPRRDSQALRLASHSLMSIAGQVGANRLQARAQCLNSAAHGEEIPEMQQTGTELVAEIDAAVAYVRERV
jgi:CheY-like chemotaxis protein